MRSRGSATPKTITLTCTSPTTAASCASTRTRSTASPSTISSALRRPTAWSRSSPDADLDSRLSKTTTLDVGLVVAGHGRHYIVETPEGERIHCHPRGKKSDCVVGDRVRWQTSGDEGVIEHVEPRRNLLFRQDEWKTKSFAANLDQLLVLVASEPVFSESQLARALIAAESADIPARIVLNKADLPAVGAARERLKPYVAMGVDVIEVALKTRPAEARDKLDALLDGKATLVL